MWVDNAQKRKESPYMETSRENDQKNKECPFLETSNDNDQKSVQKQQLLTP